MKYLLFIIVPLLLFSQENIVLNKKNGKKVFFTKYTDIKTKSVHQNVIEDCYYKNGVVSENSCYLQTGNIMVTFGKKSDYDYLQFADENNLKFIKEINKFYKTALFQVPKNNEIIDIVNQLNEKSFLQRVDIEWKKPRRLY